MNTRTFELHMKDRLKDLFPYRTRRALRHAWAFAGNKLTRSWTAKAVMCDLLDAWDSLLGRSDPLAPPRKLVFGIGGDLFVGERFVKYFRELAGLTPDEAVLDVGCGVGRMALPLTKYLSPAGRYEGFDIVKPNVAWCRKAITPRFPNFRFQHANIFNREYNPTGRLTGERFRFPYQDASFDFVFLTSVFTHLLPDVVANYLAEIGRVLRPGGQCLASAYLLNDESTRLVKEGKARFTLFPPEGVHRVHSREVPEACVALDEAWFRETAAAAGLTRYEPHYGLWAGRDTWLDFQDVVVLRK